MINKLLHYVLKPFVEVYSQITPKLFVAFEFMHNECIYKLLMIGCCDLLLWADKSFYALSLTALKINGLLKASYLDNDYNVAHPLKDSLKTFYC